VTWPTQEGGTGGDEPIVLIVAATSRTGRHFPFALGKAQQIDGNADARQAPEQGADSAWPWRLVVRRCAMPRARSPW
jgi:hypothetical protein